MSKFKFNLCFENASYPGYCTERLYEALCAKTIPIYWGSGTAALDFNPKAFLSWHDYRNDEAFINAIIELDQDEEKYMDMYLQPMFPNGGATSKYFHSEYILDWFDKNVYKGAW
jgi:alpha(1,3/1,4) fucosyltransferase